MSKYVVRVPFDWGNAYLRDAEYKIKVFENKESADQAAICLKDSVVEEYYDIDKFDWDTLSNYQKA